MAKLTLIRRVSDGLPLAQSFPPSKEEKDGLLFYREQGDLVMAEISRRAPEASRMSIRIDHHCFHFIIEDGVCYMALFDAYYPRKLAFHYLEDLHRDCHNSYGPVMHTIANPHALSRIEFIINGIRKLYLDTRTQANLAKPKAGGGQIQEIPTQDISDFLFSQKESDRLNRHGRELSTFNSECQIWHSNMLEVIALKWMPIALIAIVAATLVWASIVIDEHYIN